MEVLSAASQLFVQGLKDKLSGTSVQVTQGSADRAALIVRSASKSLIPVPYPARMWAPGAGAAQTLISGEIVDAGTKEVLVRFRQERRFVMELIWQHESLVLSRPITAGQAVPLQAGALACSISRRSHANAWATRVSMSSLAGRQSSVWRITSLPATSAGGSPARRGVSSRFSGLPNTQNARADERGGPQRREHRDVSRMMG